MKSLRYSAIFLILILTGCSGYTLGEGGVSVLPPEYRTLAIREITNPTTLSWIEPRIRKLLRDELNNRGTITWVDTQAQADSVISIDIRRYYRPTAVSGGSDETLRSVAVFTFNATIRSTTDDSVLWQSGTISQNWPFFTGDEANADAEVTRLGIRRLADRMTQNY
ncbi:LPS assembly lipoprotein LptE [uncultured Pseudodesulfovibrio sp.]|uniref:LPS assembly lipoprotein LptE n=1 Tax=uncultured Pseudodesulfovibrio sp. TaxID=2035858 RepID=UPI0029C7392C|nr:LPS assembly lipoprotein LptE [uncultured Pseudodesulfovibrio sp.]